MPPLGQFPIRVNIVDAAQSRVRRGGVSAESGCVVVAPHKQSFPVICALSQRADAPVIAGFWWLVAWVPKRFKDPSNRYAASWKIPRSTASTPRLSLVGERVNVRLDLRSICHHNLLCYRVCSLLNLKAKSPEGVEQKSLPTLALNLDAHTNNTCLVLAFEFTDTGEVFLFPADAQVGNWLSWQDRKWKVKSPTGMTEITAPDLLSRTVFYKVGHHGSHNATLRAMGLEQMTSENLVAYVPVNVAEAQKNRWNGMPFPPLVNRLREKTHGRLLQMDQPLPTALQLKNLPKEVGAAFLESTVVGPNDLYFECSF